MCQRQRAELYMTRQDLGNYSSNIKFTLETKQALMSSQHSQSSKTYALILFSQVHYVTSSILIYLFAYLGMNVISWISLLGGTK